MSGARRELDYDASGHRISIPSSSPSIVRSTTGNLDGNCGCDLDPFTNFPRLTERVSLLADETIDGRVAIHLRFGVPNEAEPSTTDLWIDRSTYLPVRLKVVYRVRAKGKLGPAMTTTDAFTWLPRTPGACLDSQCLGVGTGLRSPHG